jgi:hypothetical protein
MSESVKRRARWAAALAVAAAVAIAGAGEAQTRLTPTNELDFDRPEAWAMKWFNSVLLMTGLGGPADLSAGGLELAVEGGWVPSLSAEERTVGFIGQKEEDLNRTSVVGRLRLAVGLPARLTLTAGYTPPVEVDGVTPHFLAVALGRPLAEGRAFRLDLRLTAQTGTIEGDLTCPAAEAAAGDDPDRNPLGCLEPSDDEMSATSAGLELAGTWSPAGAPRLTPYAAIAGYFQDNEFQVRARYATIEDRTLLVSDGTTFAATAGLGFQATERTRLVAELFYSPLDVVRDRDEGSQNDALFNARVLLGYRIR